MVQRRHGLRGRGRRASRAVTAPRHQGARPGAATIASAIQARGAQRPGLGLSAWTQLARRSVDTTAREPAEEHFVARKPEAAPLSRAEALQEVGGRMNGACHGLHACRWDSPGSAGERRTSPRCDAERGEATCGARFARGAPFDFRLSTSGRVPIPSQGAPWRRHEGGSRRARGRRGRAHASCLDRPRRARLARRRREEAGGDGVVGEVRPVHVEPREVVQARRAVAPRAAPAAIARSGRAEQ